MSHIPVSAITISAGVVIGVLRIRFSTLFSILCRVSSRSWLVSISPLHRLLWGVMQEWTSFQMMPISMLWNSSFPARLRMVCRAASVFPFVFFIWSSRFPLLFMVIPRYLYVSVGSSIWFPIRVSEVGFLLLIVSIWLLSLPNLMWYLFAMSLVMDSISCAT